MRLLRVIVFLLLAGFAGLTAYAYFGDTAADPQPMRVPVELDLGQSPAAPVTAAPEPEASPAAKPAAAADQPPASGNADDASLD